MMFLVSDWGSKPFAIDIRLFDGFDRDGVNVYVCRVNGATFYFESNAQDEIWTILDNALFALKEFRKKQVR
jgi:hypothetical protein